MLFDKLNVRFAYREPNNTLRLQVEFESGDELPKDSDVVTLGGQRYQFFAQKKSKRAIRRSESYNVISGWWMWVSLEPLPDTV